MKTIELNITHIHTVRALHIYLAYMLELPPYYGRNLDALHDLLCENSEALRIVLAGEASGDEMKAYLPRLECVLMDCAEENGSLVYLRA